MPGGVQGKPGGGTRCPGLVDTVTFSHSLDSITEVFSNLNDSVDCGGFVLGVLVLFVSLFLFWVVLFVWFWLVICLVFFQRTNMICDREKMKRGR